MLAIHPLSGDSAEDRWAVASIFLGAPSYTQLVEGRAPSEKDVGKFFDEKPTGKEEADKSAFGFRVGSEWVGCADLIRAYPTDDRAFIGLLLFAEPFQGRGYGKAALALVTEIARGWRMHWLQLAVLSTNPGALAFWRREGFEEVRRTRDPRFTGEVIVMERSIE